MALRRPREGTITHHTPPTSYKLDKGQNSVQRVSGLWVQIMEASCTLTNTVLGRPNIASPKGPPRFPVMIIIRKPIGNVHCPPPPSLMWCRRRRPCFFPLLLLFPSVYSRHIAFASTCRNKCFLLDEFSQPLNPRACKMSKLGPLQVYKLTYFRLACFHYELTMSKVTLRSWTTCFKCILWINCIPWCYWRFEFKYIV